ncbi:MAG TPA: exodeoxyribonuclease V subunit gamma, partial [Verrucomicrobiales bacterium]|nr:exodeoxyribonuclease V subunit gamma [Verrucomicrobiales bacterium]
MAGLHIHTGNRVEVLEEILAEILDQPSGNVFEEEIIVVSNKALERRLQLFLASRNGISMNLRFPFPRSYCGELFRHVLNEVPERTAFDLKALPWRIMQILPSLKLEAGFEEVNHFLREDSDGLKHFQFSKRVAGLFDQYLIFRASMIRDWDQGKETHWQAVLWREISEGLVAEHSSSLYFKFMKKALNQPENLDSIPSRICLFQTGSLPPRFLDIFSAVATQKEVHLFLIQPTPEYWGDVRPRKYGDQDEQSPLDFNFSSPSDINEEVDHSLLASFGKSGRDFFNLIWETDRIAPLLQDDTGFQDPIPAGHSFNMLTLVQSDLYRMRQPSSDEKQEVGRTDGSIQFHECHTPLREMEVLRDTLLDLMSRDDSLNPKDIAILTPDIGVYVPFIQAVFGTPESDSNRIPYTVLGGPPDAADQFIPAFLNLLKVLQSRMELSAVLDCLESESLCRRFNLTEPDVEIIREWLYEVRIRWGRDSTHRGDCGLPEYQGNTWSEGIRRLLAGYCMGNGDDKQLFADLLPANGIDFSQGELLGSFLDFFEAMDHWSIRLKGDQTLEQWVFLLSSILDSFFQIDVGDRHQMEFDALRKILSELKDSGRLSEFDRPISMTVLLEELQQEIAEVNFGLNQPGTGLVFSSFKSLQGLSFKVHCLVGMNDQVFPRPDRTLTFDKMVEHPQTGDPSRRNEDRYTFLETLVNAQEVVYLSYIGRSVHDNSRIPPATPVLELLDYLKQRFYLKGQAELSGFLVRQHRLQAFSSVYYSGEGPLFSFSRNNAEACRIAQKPRRNPFSFFDASRAVEEPLASAVVDIKELIGFFRNPCRYLIRKRLGIWLAVQPDIPGDQEAFALSGLDAYQVRDDILQARIQHEDFHALRQVHKSAGMLPPSGQGMVQHSSQEYRVTELVQRFESEFHSLGPHDHEIDFDLDETQIRGVIPSMSTEGFTHLRCGKTKPVNLIAFWIQWVLLCRKGGKNNPSEARYISSEEVWTFRRVENPESLIRNLMVKFRHGMSSPLRFFPMSSFQYVQVASAKRRQKKSPLEAVKSAWMGVKGPRYNNPGDGSDPYIDLCFRYEDPFQDPFEKNAQEILEPFFQHVEKK